MEATITDSPIISDPITADPTFSSDEKIEEESEEYQIGSKKILFANVGILNKSKPVVEIAGKTFTLKVHPGSEGLICTVIRRKGVCNFRNYTKLGGCHFSGVGLISQGRNSIVWLYLLQFGKQNPCYCFFTLMEKKLNGN